MAIDCEDVHNWQNMTPGERYDALVEYTSDLLTDLGYHVPGFEMGDVPDDAEGENDGWYDPDTDTIRFDPDLFGDDADPSGAYQMGAHEAAHSWIREELGDHFDDFDYETLHEDIYRMGVLWGGGDYESCFPPPPSESPSAPGDYPLPDGDTRYA